VLGHFLGTMAGHKPGLRVGDASASHRDKEVALGMESEYMDLFHENYDAVPAFFIVLKYLIMHSSSLRSASAGAISISGLMRT
jgi:hypothetical protein